jgi:hypothetical protein
VKEEDKKLKNIIKDERIGEEKRHRISFFFEKFFG